ncbi:MAG: aldehyde ferredoxin oxidoreductase N-terminal domain-containing protein [Dehalococcoidales bacterium]|nr:aldehyde ferredoxin oxidoreductase N-terminal domain-containing protein [Dehalococcoidales bacterium]
MFDEVPPLCDPLGKKNKLVFGIGNFGGTLAPTTGRLSVGAKSPLTGGIKEANSGGLFSTYMAQQGIKMIIIEDKPSDDGLYLLHVDQHGGAEIADIKELEGTGTYELVEKLYKRFGKNCAIAVIGPAGERMYNISAIMCTDLATREPCRAAARGGLGAVMGSKRLKAIVIEKSPGYSKNIPYHDQKCFKEASKHLTKYLMDSPVLQGRTLYGTFGAVRLNGEIGTLPVRNFRGVRFESLDKVDAKSYAEKLKCNGGKAGLACQPGCVVRCASRYHNNKGEYVTSGLQYETVGLMGSNCEIDDLDVIAALSRKCDDIGIDTIDAGAALGVFMEAGLLKWGDCKSVISLMDEIYLNTERGTLLCSGLNNIGKVLGISRLPALHGQSLAAYDPRNKKGIGITYITSAMGADHTVGDPSSSDGNYVEAALDIYSLYAVLDGMFCLFVLPVINASRKLCVEMICGMMAGLYGGKWDEAKLLSIGKETLAIEWAFNKLAGWELKGLPEFFSEEISPMTGNTFDVPEEQIDTIYRLMGEGVGVDESVD